MSQSGSVPFLFAHSTVSMQFLFFALFPLFFNITLHLTYVLKFYKKNQRFFFKNFHFCYFLARRHSCHVYEKIDFVCLCFVKKISRIFVRFSFTHIIFVYPYIKIVESKVCVILGRFYSPTKMFRA